MTPDLHLFQIFYDDATRAALDPDFQPLDNARNERPDWFEFWPIHNHLQRQPLEDDSYYGFFSPKFRDKTWLTGAKVRAFIAAQPGADVYTFSPTPDEACFYANVFEQGQSAHPGLVEVAQAFFDEIKLGIDLRRIVMDVRTSVYANYFVARGSFWRRWYGIFKSCHAHAENPASPLHQRLCAVTRYHPPVQMKIFLMERVVSALLATTPGLKIVNYPPFELPLGEKIWLPYFDKLVAMDASKLAFLQTGNEIDMTAFRNTQKAVWSTLQRKFAQGK
ncbi:MAG: hypothetical protein Q8N89_16490 [Azonexus sp.]|nr:hypothetical protein [Azonexus sp.]